MRALDCLRRTFELQDPAHARLLPMEGLRGAAVILVFLQHYTRQAQLIGQAPGPTTLITEVFRHYGNYGVELFFVLSGYLIYGTLMQGRTTFLLFMARRVQRIYPAFLIVFAGTVAVRFLIPGGIPTEFGPALVLIAENLLLLPGMLPITRIVEVAWSLSFEMFFYIVTAVVVLGLRAGQRSKQLRLGGLFVLCGLLLAAGMTGVIDIQFRALPFFAGIFLAEGLGRPVPSWAGWAAPALAFSAALSRPYLGPIEQVLQTAGFFCLCAVCFRDAGFVSIFMRLTPLRWLGNMSYSYYLLHGIVVRVAMVGLAHFVPGELPALLFWALMPVAFAATLVPAAILFVVVERPFSIRPARPHSAPRVRPA